MEYHAGLVRPTPKIWRVYSGADGKSHLAEVPLDMKPFSDTEGAHGEGTPAQTARSISFRVSPPGYELDVDTMARVVRTIAPSCTSTAWVLAFYIGHNWLHALFPERSPR